METIKQIKKWFANERYSWSSKNDFEYEWKLDEMKQDYIDELWTLDPEWEDENKIYEAWYVRWYEVALHDLMNYFKSINIATEWWSEWKYYPTITTDKLEDMLNNLLTN